MNVIITGSSRGIGFGLAKEFLKNNHNVLINSTSKEKIDVALIKLKDFSNNIVSLVCDVNNPDFVENAFKLMNERFGKVDIWLNNAGIPQPYKNIHELQDSEVEKLLTVNLISVINITKKVFVKMNQNGGGKIFNMEGFGSDGRMGYKMTLYGTSKRALTYFTKSYANEIKETKVFLSRMSPGMVITDFLNEAQKNMSEKENKQFKQIFNILGSPVEEVSAYLYKAIIKSNKNNDSINFLKTSKIIYRFVRHLFSPKNYFKN